MLWLGAPCALARAPWGEYAKQPDAWYQTDEARHIADTLLTYQSLHGSWPKNIDTASHPYEGDPHDLLGNFDNGATLGELRFLARMLAVAPDARYQQAFDRGLDALLTAQYPSGGWPQRFPPGDGYARYITFNDNTMVGIMRFLREVATSQRYRFVEANRRQQAQAAFDRGIECILKCQIVVDGQRTAWCAQHDPVNYSPRPARTYELVSLSGSESVEITRLLMSLEQPSPEVIRAVLTAVAWFRAAAVHGMRIEQQPDPAAPRGTNKVVVADPTAPPLWARFHEIGTNRPIFSSRDGVARFHLAEISSERRNGYGWLGTWPTELLDKEFPAWQARWVKP